jgi:phenylpyruvate tautomerase PptA (4-oxalocrotonate tautomerase family)
MGAVVAQIKVYGIAERLNPIKRQLSNIIHSCVVDALAFPIEKRFHRFFPLAKDDFVYPSDRSDCYTLIEISMFEGRSIETKKQLIRLLFARLKQDISLAPNDVEITITETPRSNWGIRGQPGDELALGYAVKV